NTIPITAGTNYVIIPRPNELVSVTSDGTGADITVERVNSSFADQNEYRVTVTDPGAGVTALTLNGGPRLIQHIALHDRFSIDGSDITSGTVAEGQLDGQVVDRLLTAEEREDLAVVANNVFDQTVVTGTDRDRNRKVISRFVAFFDNPTSDGGAFPTNQANNTANISVSNQSPA
ncbi:hypothetical protein M8745_20570, partial [Lutimaribacter sp. EGI FJ00014]|nr:hypothetical protein [Lutimaribacter sp. EGI FJ00014]